MLDKFRRPYTQQVKRFEILQYEQIIVVKPMIFTNSSNLFLE
jgi:hypothetical protein